MRCGPQRVRPPGEFGVRSYASSPALPSASVCRLSDPPPHRTPAATLPSPRCVSLFGERAMLQAWALMPPRPFQPAPLCLACVARVFGSIIVDSKQIPCCTAVSTGRLTRIQRHVMMSRLANAGGDSVQGVCCHLWTRGIAVLGGAPCAVRVLRANAVVLSRPLPAWPCANGRGARGGSHEERKV